ncbi:Fc.00g013560.m01.CDS01 [Cosmosporella sp. VM-42]
MHHQETSSSHHIPPPSNNQHHHQIVTAKLGDFAKLRSSSAALSVSSEQSWDSVSNPLNGLSLHFHETSRHEDDSPSTKNKTVTLGNFSRIFDLLGTKPPSVPTSKVDNTPTSHIEQDGFSRVNRLASLAQLDSDRSAEDLSTLLPYSAPCIEVDSDVPDLLTQDGSVEKRFTRLAHRNDQATKHHDTSAPVFDSDYGASTSTTDTTLPVVFDKPTLTKCFDSDFTDSDHDSEYSSYTPIPKPRRGKKLFTYQAPPRTGPWKAIYDDMRCKAEKHESLCCKMLEIPHDEGNVNGIHVFLDTSNITIGFKQTLLAKYNVQEHSILKPMPRLNIEFLHELLVRDRDVAGLLAGCSTLPGMKGQYYVQELNSLGYRVDLRHRQLDPVQLTPDKRASGRDRYVESLVDETIQARMGETIMEFNRHPGTIIIATGDAKPAPFSAGFYHYARWALELGWNVEVVAWSSTLSQTWMKDDFCKQWGNRFRVITLDPFLDELFERYGDE